MRVTELLKKLLRHGKESSFLLGYKNFENQVFHCLEPDDSQITISKKLIGNLINTIQDAAENIALQKPTANDALPKLIKVEPCKENIRAGTSKKGYTIRYQMLNDLL